MAKVEQVGRGTERQQASTDARHRRASNEAIAGWRSARRELRSADDALAEAEASAGLRPRMPVWLRRALPAFGIALIVVAGIGIWFAVSAPKQYSDDDYLDAASSRVGLLLNADADDPSRAKRILAGATGAFEAAFAQSADAYSTYVKESDAHGDGSIDAVAIQGRSPDGADVLVAASLQVGNRSTESVEQGAAPVRTMRMVVSMVPVDGQLKIERLVVVP